MDVFEQFEAIKMAYIGECMKHEELHECRRCQMKDCVNNTNPEYRKVRRINTARFVDWLHEKIDECDKNARVFGERGDYADAMAEQDDMTTYQFILSRIVGSTEEMGEFMEEE